MKEVVIFAPIWQKLPINGYGAIERVTLERSVALRNLGYRVQIVANLEQDGIADEIIYADTNSKYPKNKKEEAYWLLTLKWRKYLSSYSKLSNEIWDAPILSDQASIDPFDNNYLSKKMRPRKLLYYLHGNYYFSNRMAKFLFKPLDTIVRSTRKTLYGTLNKHLLNEFKKRDLPAFYMPNGINFPDEKEIMRTNSDPFLLFVGAIRPTKAPHIAIEISKKLNKKLVIVGPIHDSQYFNQMVKPNLNSMIQYKGEISRSDVDSLFSSASALLFTSQWNDPQPTVVLEAMSHGTPVLALNYGFYSGIYEMVENYRNGFLGNVSQIVDNFEEISDLKKVDVYRHTKTKWSWDFVLKNYHVPVIDMMAEE